MSQNELLDAFVQESSSIVAELKVITENLENTTGSFPSELLQDFSQKVDRIMGAAKTLSIEEPQNISLVHIATLAELAKYIGYKTSETQKAALVPIVAAFWIDLISVVENLLNSLQNPGDKPQDFTSILIRRLEWLKKKLSPDGAVKSAEQTQKDIDAIISKLKVN